MCESPEYYSINIEALSKLHTQPPKDSSISFTVRLAVNDNSDASNGIPASDVPCCGVAVRFAAGRYPKLQSFVAANHSKWKDLILLVGGRYMTCRRRLVCRMINIPRWCTWPVLLDMIHPYVNSLLIAFDSLILF